MNVEQSVNTKSQTIRLVTALAAILAISTSGSGRAAAQFGITEIINETGGRLATFPNHLRRKQK